MKTKKKFYHLSNVCQTMSKFLRWDSVFRTHLFCLFIVVFSIRDPLKAWLAQRWGLYYLSDGSKLCKLLSLSCNSRKVWKRKNYQSICRHTDWTMGKLKPRSLESFLLLVEHNFLSLRTFYICSLKSTLKQQQQLSSYIELCY